MSMSYIWAAMVAVSVLFGAMQRTLSAVTNAMLEGAQNGVQLCISLAGPLCLWSGLACVMERCGLSTSLAKLLRPLLRKLFPQASADGEAAACLCGNLTANLLGLGNAATPLGIRAAKRMHVLSGSQDASDELCRLIVMNTASVQLIPATVAACRAALGAAQPFSILPAVWVTSLLSVSAGLLAAWGMGRLKR